jgi:glutaryl-CoA dehydrogenase
MSPKAREIKDRVTKYMREITPSLNELQDKEEFPYFALDGLRELGINGFHIKGNGSPGLSLIDSLVIFSEISSFDGSIGLFFLVNSILGMSTLDILGSEEWKAKILPDAVKLNKFMGYALTEPFKGSEAINLDTIVTKVDGGYIMNGAKKWIGNGPIADYLLVWAKNVSDKDKI